MKAIQNTIVCLTFFMSTPIWYFLLHTLLVHAQVDRLCWFLYWVYVPVGILSSVLAALLKGQK